MNNDTRMDKTSTPFKKGAPSASEEEIIYSALGSQIRREIVLFIKERAKVGFVELREKFPLKVGSLYHQLNSMKELLTQDENKKYCLSPLGEVAYDLLILNKDHLSSSDAIVTKKATESKMPLFVEKIIDGITFFFLPRVIFQYFVSSPVRTLFEGLIIIGAMIFFSIDSGKVLIGFFPIDVDYWYLSLISVLGLWIFLAIITDVFKTIFYKKKFNPLILLSVVPFALIPSMIVLFCLWLQSKVTTTFLFLDGQILIILGQIWSLSLMTTAVSKAAKLTMNRSSLIVLFTFYLTYIVSFVLIGIS